MVSTENKNHCENIVEGTVKNQITMHCQERSFVRLPGYVDVDVFSLNSLETIKDAPLKIAVTVCKLKPAEEHHVMQYEAIKASLNESVFVNMQSLVDTLAALQQCPPADGATMAELNEYMGSLDSHETQINNELTSNPSTLDSDRERKARIEAYFEETKQIGQEVRGRIQRLIRVAAMGQRK